MPFRLLHRIFLFFIRSRSPLRSFMENQIYGTIAANTLQGSLQHPPLTMRRFSANLSHFSDFAELQTHNRNRLALHINRTNFLKATKAEESVSTRKFDSRKTNTPTRIGLYVKNHAKTLRASSQWEVASWGEKNEVLREVRKSADFPFIYGAFPLKNPTSSLFQAHETTVSGVWNNCFRRMKQLFQAYETTVSSVWNSGFNVESTGNIRFRVTTLVADCKSRPLPRAIITWLRMIFAGECDMSSSAESAFWKYW